MLALDQYIKLYERGGAELKSRCESNSEGKPRKKVAAITLDGEGSQWARRLC